MAAASISKGTRAFDHASRGLTPLIPLLVVAGPAPLDVGAILITVLFLVRSAVTRDFRWLRERWLQLALLLWVYFCARNAFVDGAAFGRAAGWVRYPLFAAALAHWSLRDPTTARWTRHTLIVAVLFLVGDTLYQYLYRMDLFGRPALMNDGTLRLTGPYSAPRVGVTIAWLMFPGMLWCLAHKRWRWRLGGIGMALAAAAAVLASGERTALLLLACGMAASFLFSARARVPLLIIAALGALGAATMLDSNPALKARQVGAMEHGVRHFGDSVYGRMWQAGAAIAEDYAAFGVGSKQFQPVCSRPAYGPTDPDSLIQRCPMHPHNMYVEWAVEGGLIALALWLMLLGTWVMRAYREWRHWLGQPLATGLLIAVGIKLFPIAVTPSQFVAWAALPLWFMAGWLLALLPRKTA